MRLFILYSIKNFIPILSYTSLANVNTENKEYKHGNMTASPYGTVQFWKIDPVYNIVYIYQSALKEGLHFQFYFGG